MNIERLHLEELSTRKSAYQIRFCIFIDTKNFEMKIFILNCYQLYVTKM